MAKDNNLDDEAQKLHDEINAKLQAETRKLKGNDTSSSSTSQNTSASKESSEQKADSESRFTTPPNAKNRAASENNSTENSSDTATKAPQDTDKPSAADGTKKRVQRPKTEDFTVPVVEPDHSQQNYKYVRSGNVAGGSNAQKSSQGQNTASNAPATQTGGGANGGNNGGGKQAGAAPGKELFPNSPKSLELTPQIKQDYSHITPPKAKKTRGPSKPGDPKKKLLAIGAGTALVFAGGAYILDEATTDSPSSSYSSSGNDRSDTSNTDVAQFGQPVAWDNVGVHMEVPDPRLATSTSMTQGTDSGKYIVFTVKVTNTSDHTIKASNLSGIHPEVYYGSSQREAKQVTDPSNKVTDDTFDTLKPGETQTKRYGFFVPSSGLNQVTLDMGKPNKAKESAVFQGSYKASSDTGSSQFSDQDSN